MSVPAPRPLALPSRLWRTVAGHQCRLLEGGRTGRLIGQTAPKTCHISRPVLFRLLRHHPTAASAASAAARVSQVARRLTMQGDGCGKGGTDLTAHACLAMLQHHLSLQIWKSLRDPCLQPTCSTPPTSRDPPRSFVRALQSSLLIPQSWTVPMIEQPRLRSNIRRLPQARQTFSIGLCVCVKGLHCVPPQVSTSQFFPPIGQFVQSSTPPG